MRLWVWGSWMPGHWRFKLSVWGVKFSIYLHKVLDMLDSELPCSAGMRRVSCQSFRHLGKWSGNAKLLRLGRSLLLLRHISEYHPSLIKQFSPENETEGQAWNPGTRASLNAVVVSNETADSRRRGCLHVTTQLAAAAQGCQA